MQQIYLGDRKFGVGHGLANNNVKNIDIKSIDDNNKELLMFSVNPMELIKYSQLSLNE